MLSGEKWPYPILPPTATRPCPGSPISISSDSSCSSYSVGSYDRFTDDETDRRYAQDEEDSEESDDGLADDQSWDSLEERRMRKAAVIAERKRMTAERLESWPEAQRLERHVEIDVALIQTKRRNRRLTQERAALWERVHKLERRVRADEFMKRLEDFDETVARLQAQHREELEQLQHRCEELQAKLKQCQPLPQEHSVGVGPGCASRVLLQRLLGPIPSTAPPNPNPNPLNTVDTPTQASSSSSSTESEGEGEGGTHRGRRGLEGEGGDMLLE